LLDPPELIVEFPSGAFHLKLSAHPAYGEMGHVPVQVSINPTLATRFDPFLHEE
jgi:hypothetical protein